MGTDKAAPTGSEPATDAVAAEHVHEYGGADHHHHPHRHSPGAADPEDGHHHRSSGVSVHGGVHDDTDGRHEHPHTHMSAQELGAVFLKQMNFPSDPPTPTTTAEGQ